MNKQQLANKIWESANKMRSKIEANEYKDYILGFIFYKFLSDKEEQLLRGEGWEDSDLAELTEEDTETVEYCQRKNGYFIPYEYLFSTWLAKGSDFDASNVTDALSSFSRLIDSKHKKVFDKIFNTLETGLSKLGDTSGKRTKAISDLLQLIKDIPMNGKEDYDVLGFIYEYLISNFAANAGKKAGEFYTPHEVSLLMSEIVANHLKGRDKIEIYDPTSGSGSLLINIGRVVAKHMGDSNNIKYYAQEWKENTYNLTRMNLVMRGILPDNIVARNGDTLEEDWPYFDETHSYSPLYVDAVVSNPPYSQHWDATADKKQDPRYADYGLAPKGKADYAFLLHDLYHIKPDGIMTIVLPHGVLFRGGEEGTIREQLIEHNNIDAIIGLPANIFFGTGIPTIIMVLRQHRENTDVLIVDASKHFEKVGKNNKLTAADIKRIIDVVTQRKDKDKFSRVVTRDEIRNNGYNLNIPRYVDSSEAAEKWDILATMSGGIPNSEIEDFHEYWEAFPSLKEELFKEENSAYSSLIASNVIDVLHNNKDISNFKDSYKEAFNDFDEYLYGNLIANLRSSTITISEEEISNNIFGRLKDIPLVDKYAAYQAMDNVWNVISSDIETITREGYDAIKIVDPNMVVKKKDGKEVEVQEGWIGRIIPFEITQKLFFKEKLNELNSNNSRLNEITSEYEELLDSLTEEQKSGEYINDDNDAFVWKEAKNAVKKNTVDAEIIDILKKAIKLNDEEKALKKSVKNSNIELQNETKAKIENLTDSEIDMLLTEKWINSMVFPIASLPDTIISNMSKKITALSVKYSETLLELDKEIKKTEADLSLMLSDLTGNEYDMKGIEELKDLLEAKRIIEGE